MGSPQQPDIEERLERWNARQAVYGSMRSQAGNGLSVAAVIAGGPACDWERWHMSSPQDLPDTGSYNGESEQHIRTSFPNLRLKVCTNPPDLESFLKRGMPLEECQ